ncbi:uncharacterized protein LOC129095303 [Anoplopoma fimbria]|uniref:uncharacterized protein LOC129095303 n=1 Tax=Anoplopoma fimbria TaxID=229290 RepID=UPI0023EA8451|nr:uncharacterized protein LOC129095303 [Anoplopoma fimbria]
MTVVPDYSVTVIQGQDYLGVTYTSTQICALKGSTVNIPCTFTYPSTGNDGVEGGLWFTKGRSRSHVDLTTDSHYRDRVEYRRHEDDCTLRIKDLRESDSAEYEFKPNQPGGGLTGSPGVFLSVTANYTWYKEGEDSPKASGRIFTITDFRAEHSGNYSCVVLNSRGRHHSTLHLIAVAGTWKLLAVASVPTFVLGIIFISVFLCIITKKTSKQRSERGERPDASERMEPAEQQDELHYASVHFSKNQADPVYSNIGPAPSRRYEEETREEEEMIVYAAVALNPVASRTRGQDAAEDPAALYCMVNKERNL